MYLNLTYILKTSNVTLESWKRVNTFSPTISFLTFTLFSYHIWYLNFYIFKTKHLKERSLQILFQFSTTTKKILKKENESQSHVKIFAYSFSLKRAANPVTTFPPSSTVLGFTAGGCHVTFEPSSASFSPSTTPFCFTLLHSDNHLARIYSAFLHGGIGIPFFFKLCLTASDIILTIWSNRPHFPT